MPDDETPSVVPLAEFQALQRKYARRDKTASTVQAQVEQQGAALARMETLLESLTQVVAHDSPAAQERVTALVTANSSRRSLDQTTAQLTARVNAAIDNADMEWTDPKFAKAHEIFREIEQTGNLARAPEMEAAVLAAIKGEDSSTSLEDRIAAAVAAALHANKQDSVRTDTGGSTVRSGAVTRSQLATANPAQGLANLKSQIDQVWSQMTK